jgi:hypothetical protein
MLWARESNSYRSRGSLHGSRYSRSGATRKGEKAMAGQRKTPTTGAVTVSEPTDRQTPKRAGSAVVTNSRKSGTPVGSGSRVTAPGTNPPLRGVMREACFYGQIVGAPTPVGGTSCAPAILTPRPWAALDRRQPSLPSLLPSRVTTRFGFAPASGGPPLGGRAGEPQSGECSSRMAYCPVHSRAFAAPRSNTWPVSY